ncbi:MAG: hypothetical protein Q4F79_04785 [Eubacteriales bacterium]|nr:hypothetical protein [Eubacteriales bacterium]
MATSKNNRKKGRKRQPMHQRPVPDHVAKAQQEQQEEELKSLSRIRTVSLIGMIVMIVGFVLVVMNYALIGYPITFAGAVISMVSTPPDMKHRKITIAGYLIYCLMVLFLWVCMLVA